MADTEENQVGEEEQPQDNDENQPKKAPPPVGIKSPTPGRVHGIPDQPKSVVRRAAQYSAGKPSKHDKNKLMRSEGIIPIQAGSNKYASQRGMTGNVF
ncbi:unnamed protein product [Toxocara canis]|uniref:Alpha-endosulfine n=1 Tax=Toxocara canis TaxID=6265 RepID=A0A183U0P1_TOXCA|nr:unnamed protein product [Toxocara canis]